jgi:hypothetical protein
MSTSHTAAARFDPAILDPTNLAAPADLDRVRSKALLIGLIGLVATLAGYFVNRPVFFRAYLVAWVVCLSIPLGSLAFSMIHHLTGGGWGLVVRRIFEAATRTLPVLAVLGIPLFLLGLPELYVWARPDVMAHDELLQKKAAYLNATAFYVRYVAYFAVWIFLAWRLNRLSSAQDAKADVSITTAFKRVAAPGIIAYCLVATFAGVDWLMSIEPHWFSTIYGIYFFGGHGLTAMAFLILMARYLVAREPMNQVLKANHFHDYGKLLFATTMLWAYFSFSQFLIIWAGNLPEEQVWYDHRIRHGWGPLALLIAIFHFGVPFLLLLSRGLKRRPRTLAMVASLMLVMRWADNFWQIEPAFSQKAFSFHWLFPAAAVGLGGLWLWVFLGQLKKRPLLPVNDPYLAEALGR